MSHKRFGKLLAIALVPLGASLCFVASARAAAPAGVFVQVRNTNLRSQPKQWAASVGQLSFGDRVDVIEHQGDWFKVKAKGSKQGFVHASAFVSDNPELETSGSVEGQSGSQAVLAGKGFDPSVEKQFANGDVAVDFAAVDRMERVTVSSSQIDGFIKQGKLAGEG